jgi:tetratricopeptide (TPR) repeat protein
VTRDQSDARDAIIGARRAQPLLTRELAEAYLERYPADSVVWACYGDALTSLGSFAEARVALDAARELVRSAVETKTVLRLTGRLCEETGDYAAAERVYREGAALEPQKGVWWLYVGTALRRLGRDVEAEGCFRRALTLEGARDEYLLNLGYVLQARGDYEQALRCFVDALAIDPVYPEALEAAAELEAVLRVHEGRRRTATA